MCVAVPGKIISLNPSLMALVDFGGATRDVSVAFLEEPAVGEYVMVHAGYALRKVDREEAEETLELLSKVLDETGL